MRFNSFFMKKILIWVLRQRKGPIQSTIYVPIALSHLIRSPPSFRRPPPSYRRSTTIHIGSVPASHPVTIFHVNKQEWARFSALGRHFPVKRFPEQMFGQLVWLWRLPQVNYNSLWKETLTFAAERLSAVEISSPSNSNSHQRLMSEITSNGAEKHRA